MKTLREVIKELQEFGEKNNAMELPAVSEYDGCYSSFHPYIEVNL